MTTPTENRALLVMIVAVSLVGAALGRCTFDPITHVHRSTLRELCEQRGGVLVDLGHDDGDQCFNRSAVIDDLGRD